MLFQDCKGKRRISLDLFGSSGQHIGVGLPALKQGNESQNS